MKKLVSFVMAVLVLAQIFVCGATVSAVEPAMISISSAEGREGEAVTLAVSIANNTGFGGIDLDVKFDTKVVEYVGVETRLMDGFFQSSPAQTANTEGVLKLAYVGTENVTTDGELFYITFIIKEGAEEGDSAVTLIFDDSSFVYNGVEMLDFTASVTDGKVTVENGLLGDVNNDGLIDANDLTILARHTGKIEFITDLRALANADINQDGSVNAEDLTKLARHVGKIEFIVQ